MKNNIETCRNDHPLIAYEDYFMGEYLGCPVCKAFKELNDLKARIYSLEEQLESAINTLVKNDL